MLAKMTHYYRLCVENKTYVWCIQWLNKKCFALKHNNVGFMAPTHVWGLHMGIRMHGEDFTNGFFKNKTYLIHRLTYNGCNIDGKQPNLPGVIKLGYNLENTIHLSFIW